MIVIADTSPINYLIMIGEVDLLHQLYGRVVVPQAVLSELEDKNTPSIVQDWVARRPVWFSLAQPCSTTFDKSLERLGRGERDARLRRRTILLAGWTMARVYFGSRFAKPERFWRVCCAADD
jgi:predicted nucleic acid-binding protein